jgi:hypothetical protein
MQSLTGFKLLVLALAGVAILRVWLKSTLMEDSRERLKLLNEKHLLGLGEKISELSQCAHCLSVHIGMSLSAATTLCLWLASSGWSLGIITAVAIETAVFGLALSVCVELLYRLFDLSIEWLQDAGDVLKTVANFKENDEF